MDPSRSNLLRTRILPAIAALSLVAMTAGCEARDTADLTNGQELFTERCGTCHKLEHAGTAGVQGPDLDATYAQSRADGMTAETIRGVVRGQISNPRQQGAGTDPALTMPADIVTGQDAADVAAYVGRWAGVPGVEPDPIAGAPESDHPGAQIFAEQGCGGCHVFSAGGGQGTTGPNLDESMPGRDPDDVREEIVDPNATITPGFSSGVMPDDYGDILSDEELDQLVEFLLTEAGG